MDTHTPNTNTTTTTPPLSTRLDENPTTHHTSCHLCNYPPWANTIPHYIAIDSSEYDSVTASASHGCPGCKLFQHALDLTTRHGGPELLQYFHTPAFYNGVEFSLNLMRYHGSVQFEMFTVEGERSVPNIRVARMLPERTGVEESLGVVRRWLQACEERHDLCGQESGFMPMRLLDVRVGERASGEIVRLVGTDGWEGSVALPRYACLSHCWETKKSRHITKRENLANNMRGILLEELPRTFRDAVSVTRALGIDYLWVDSLCIVQDDESDWALHVEVMANVYQNAYITLAAGASEGGEGGFSRVADKVYSDPKSIEVTVDELDPEKATIYLRPYLPHMDEVWGHDRMPLETRGWAFQERLLSRRFLCFGAHEVQWECHEATACSCSTTKDGFNNRSRKYGNPGFPWCKGTKYELVRVKTMDREAISKLWRQIIEQYSNRKLTFAKDKLPALAGLANVFAAATQDEYAYGHWLSTMKEDLPWSINFRGGGRPRKTPSWSWVSAADEGTVEWPSEQPYDSTIQIHGLREERLELSGHIAPVLLEIFGQKDGNSLSLHCYVMRRTSQKPISQKDLSISDRITEDWRESDLPYILPLAWQTFAIGDDQKNCASFFPDYMFWDDAKDLEKIFRGIYLLDMGNIQERKVPFGHPEGKFGWVMGLVLRKQPETRTASDAPCAYERIGLLYFHTGNVDKWDPVGEYLRIQIA